MPILDVGMLYTVLRRYITVNPMCENIWMGRNTLMPSWHVQGKQKPLQSVTS